MRISTNVPALTAYNALNHTGSQIQKTIQKLSTGLRINSASDDAAGLAISEKMRAQIAGLDMAQRNAQDGISMLQTAEGALSSTQSILQRMRELSVQAANDTLTANDRSFIQLEIDELKDEINRIANTTQFNGKRLLDGSSGALWAANDLGTKALVRGGLVDLDQFNQKVVSEGNYNIEIRATPGTAQVQKSGIFNIAKVKDLTDKNVNDKAGAQDVSADGLPAGDFTIGTQTAAEKASVETTGTFGISAEELNTILEWNARDIYVENNASILFEVTNVDTANGTLTLKAKANTLTKDGVEASYEKIIVLSENSWTDLSTDLGVGRAGMVDNAADGALEMRVKSGKLNELAVGIKFSERVTPPSKGTGSEVGLTVEGVQNPNAPGSSETKATAQVQQATLTMAPVSAATPAKAKVLFLIDDSGTMNSSPTYYINTVRDNIKAFVDKIGADQVEIGVAAYSDNHDGHLDPKTLSGSMWFSSKADAYTVLDCFTTSSANVNPYWGITEAVAGYDWSDADVRHIVLVTDTGQELPDPSVTMEQAKKALSDNKITLSAAYLPGRDDRRGDGKTRDGKSDIAGLISTSGKSYTLSDTNWGEQFSSELGTQIGGEIKALMNPTLDTPLYEIEQFKEYFDSAGHLITHTDPDTGETLYPVVDIILANHTGIGTTFDETDTLETLIGKLNELHKQMVEEGIWPAEDPEKPFISYENGVFTINSPIKGANGCFEVWDGFSSFNDKGERINSLKFGEKEKARDASGTELEGGKVYGGSVTENPMKYVLNPNSVKNKEIHLREFYINRNTGEVTEGDIVLTTGDKPLEENATLATFGTVYEGQPATTGTNLRNILSLYNANGVFMLDAPQTITITQGDGKSTNVTLYANDTIEDVRSKLNSAIADGLGQARHVTGDVNRFVTFVQQGRAQDNGFETVEGTFIIRSAVPGRAGELSFSGDQDLLNALALNTIQESSESRYTASVYNAHTGAAVATNVRVTGNQLHGIIHENVDVEFDAMSGIKAEWNEVMKRYELTGGESRLTIHLTDNSTALQVGANRGEDFYLDIGNMSTDALGVTQVNVLTRERAAQSISQLDVAINKVSAQRAKIGASQNSLEYTIENLQTTATNLTAAESRIRDADMAKTMMEFVKLQILNQSGTSMLAQANQLPQQVLSLLQ